VTAALPTRDELVQALAAVDGNQRSHWALLDRLYGPLADGVLALLAAPVSSPAGEDVERVARVLYERDPLPGKPTWAEAVEESDEWPDGICRYAVTKARSNAHAVLAALPARPVEAQEGYWQLAQVLREVEAERDAALARAEAAEAERDEWKAKAHAAWAQGDKDAQRILALRAVIEKVRALAVAWGAGTVHPPRSPYYRRLRALLDGDSEGRE
jgi:hypothetical protein